MKFLCLKIIFVFVLKYSVSMISIFFIFSYYKTNHKDMLLKKIIKPCIAQSISLDLEKELNKIPNYYKIEWPMQ